MLVSFPDLLVPRRGAVGAFTAYDLETATAVLGAAEAAGAPVILLISRDSFTDDLVVALRALAERTPVPCCLQLDHVGDLGLMTRALELGVSALMADGSKLPLGQNKELVAKAVALAERHGAHVEAELGHVAGGEDVWAATEVGALTDPATAAEFVDATGAACLAVSIGNVHGKYVEPPRLDWPRLEAVRAATPVPLSLHGASGIPDADMRRSIGLGIAKVNVNAELRAAYLAATAENLDAAREGLNLLALHEQQSAAVAAVVTAKLENYAP